MEESNILDNSLTRDLFNQDSVNSDMRAYQKITKYFSKNMLKLLYQIALDNNLTDNNKKAEFIDKLLEAKCPGTFRRIGTGTNRTAFQRGYFVFKIALDRRGIIDNLMEYRRSPENPAMLARTYETNGLIAVSEYVNLFTQDEFAANREPILFLLSNLAKNYIFGDMGYTSKNYCNFGYRKSYNGQKKMSREIVILDYAYMHPKWQNEDVLICPQCGNELSYTANYTGFICFNPNCGANYTYLDLKRRMSNSYENIENMYMSNISLLDMPDMENIAMDWSDQLLPDDMAEAQAVPIYIPE